MSHDTKMTEALVDDAKAFAIKEEGDELLSSYQYHASKHYSALGHGAAADALYTAEGCAARLKKLGLPVPSLLEAARGYEFHPFNR
tara:strand:+ start:6974 stop:7231 length:258 start_codon:yes stop_codon:yes gene_type:complete